MVLLVNSTHDCIMVRHHKYRKNCSSNNSKLIRKRTNTKIAPLLLQLVLAGTLLLPCNTGSVLRVYAYVQQQQNLVYRSHTVGSTNRLRQDSCIRSSRTRWTRTDVTTHPGTHCYMNLSPVNNDDGDPKTNGNDQNTIESSLLSSTSSLVSNRKNVPSKANKKSTAGIYIRPSAAIERGSGFFIPGLEGYKVRILVGCIVMFCTLLNHLYDQWIVIQDVDPTAIAATATSISTTMSGNTFAEALAIFYGALVFLQGSIEARKENLPLNNPWENSDRAATTTGRNVQLLQQQWSIENSEDSPPGSVWRQRIEWVASSYISLTPATNMMLIGPGKIIFSLGTTPRRIIESDNEVLGCSAALATLAQSTSGRVALPINHICVQKLVLSSFPNDNSTNIPSPRCAVLQRIDDQLCWMMTSDQLLVGFTAYDLQWLGQLAVYVNPEQQ
jgi:hypothetical protein